MLTQHLPWQSNGYLILSVTKSLLISTKPLHLQPTPSTLMAIPFIQVPKPKIFELSLLSFCYSPYPDCKKSHQFFIQNISRIQPTFHISACCHPGTNHHLFPRLLYLPVSLFLPLPSVVYSQRAQPQSSFQNINQIILLPLLKPLMVSHFTLSKSHVQCIDFQYPTNLAFTYFISSHYCPSLIGLQNQCSFCLDCSPPSQQGGELLHRPHTHS